MMQFSHSRVGLGQKVKMLIRFWMLVRAFF